MPDLRLVYSAVKGEWAEAMRQKYLPVAMAATQAVGDVALQVKTQGRSAIAAAGFSRRWQNALRVNVYPEKGRVSVDAAAFIYHKIPYAVFLRMAHGFPEVRCCGFHSPTFNSASAVSG